MPLSAKRTAVKVMSRFPVYRVMPPGAIRTFAGLRYYGENRPAHQTAQFIDSLGGIPTRYFSAAIVAARAAFWVGADDAVNAAIDDLGKRFPEKPELYNLIADMHAYHGRPEAALQAAERARMLKPSSAAAVLRTVKYGYRVHDRATADAAAVAAISRMPRTGTVLWTVCKLCDSAEQYARLQAAWDERLEEPEDLLRAVRPLATAAARAGDMDAAMGLYRRAMVLLREGAERSVRFHATTLEGRGAWSAIEDLHAALEPTGIPYFFAAGTALGLVREGRPLAADGDIDVGIPEEHYDRDALVELFATNPRFDFDDVHPHTKKVGLRHRGGSPVDIFRFYRDGDRMWHDAVFVRWHNTPFELQRLNLRGLDLPVPANADRYLTENYDDWRTPNPDFDAFIDDAPNVTTTWPEYLELHFMRRAYRQMADGDREAAARELTRAGEHELAASLATKRR